MQKVTHSEYIAQKKPLAKQLLAKLNEKYQYASVLITDNYEKGYRASRSGVAISATNAFGGKGMIVKVYDGKGYAEYSTNEITAENLPEIEREIEQQLMNPANFIPEGTEEAEYKCISDEPCTLCEATDYEIHPREVGDEKLIETVTRCSENAVKADDASDAITGFNYQEYHKLFLSANRELEQSVLYSTGIMALVAAKARKSSRASADSPTSAVRSCLIKWSLQFRSA